MLPENARPSRPLANHQCSCDDLEVERACPASTPCDWTGVSSEVASHLEAEHSERYESFLVCPYDTECGWFGSGSADQQLAVRAHLTEAHGLESFEIWRQLSSADRADLHFFVRAPSGPRSESWRSVAQRSALLWQESRRNFATANRLGQAPTQLPPSAVRRDAEAGIQRASESVTPTARHRADTYAEGVKKFEKGQEDRRIAETKAAEAASLRHRQEKYRFWLGAAGAAGFMLFLLWLSDASGLSGGGGNSNSERRCPYGAVSCEEQYGDEWLEHDQQRFP